MFTIFFIDDRQHFRTLETNSLQNVKFGVWNFVVSVFQERSMMPVSALTGLTNMERMFYGKIDLYKNDFYLNNIVLQNDKRSLQISIGYDAEYILLRNEYFGNNPSTCNIIYEYDQDRDYNYFISKIGYKGLGFVDCEIQRLKNAFFNPTEIIVAFYNNVGELSKTVSQSYGMKIPFFNIMESDVDYGDIVDQNDQPFDFGYFVKSEDLKELIDPNILRSGKIINALDNVKTEFMFNFINTYLIVRVKSGGMRADDYPNSGRIITRIATF